MKNENRKVFNSDNIDKELLKRKIELDLDKRMKQYEKDYDNRIEYNKHLLIRLDGHKFSKFTKNLDKPFDELFTRAMIDTTKDLAKKFGSYTSFTQSDEITLMIPMSYIEEEVEITNNQIFAGRCQKIASLTASYCTLRFNYHWEKAIEEKIYEYECLDVESVYDLSQERVNENKLKTYQDNIQKGFFDARVYGVDDDSEVLNAFLFRTRDCITNTKNSYAQTFCSHKSLLNKSSQEQIEFCKEMTDNDWYTLKDVDKFGTFIKKELYNKVVEYKGNTQTVQRSRFVEIHKQMTNYSKENVGFVMSKYIEN